MMGVGAWDRWSYSRAHGGCYGCHIGVGGHRGMGG